MTRITQDLQARMAEIRHGLGSLPGHHDAAEPIWGGGLAQLLSTMKKAIPVQLHECEVVGGPSLMEGDATLEGSPGTGTYTRAVFLTAEDAAYAAAAWNALPALLIEVVA